jgi:hypothetical protein
MEPWSLARTEVLGGKQLGFLVQELTTAKKQTKREKFLAEMEAVVPWTAFIALIEPHYPKVSKKGDRPPYTLAIMLPIQPLQHWYSLSDPAMEEALIKVPSMRRFAGIELISHLIPDETTILSFRHLLEKHDLGEQIVETVKDHLRHDHGCDLDCRSQLHQEQRQEAGSGDAPEQDWQPDLFRDKGPRWDGQGLLLIHKVRFSFGAHVRATG